MFSYFFSWAMSSFLDCCSFFFNLPWISCSLAWTRACFLSFSLESYFFSCVCSYFFSWKSSIINPHLSFKGLNNCILLISLRKHLHLNLGDLIPVLQMGRGVLDFLIYCRYISVDFEKVSFKEVMYVCMYACMYTYMHVILCMYVFIYQCLYMYNYMCVYACMYFVWNW